MKIPKGYCDLRVERANDDIIDAAIRLGYSWIAINNTLDCSTLGFRSSDKKKRKHSEINDEEEKDWVPTPKSINNNNLKLTVLNRLTIQITNIGQIQKIMSCRNFKLYNILAVEPLNDKLYQDLVNLTSIDVIVCSLRTMISPKEYKVGVEKNIHFEVCYGPMLMNSTVRQETITLAHLLHIKGKSKNVIVSSGANNALDLRNPHDVMNLGILLGLSQKQSKESITQACYSVVLNGYGRKLGKTATSLIPMNSQVKNKT